MGFTEAAHPSLLIVPDQVGSSRVTVGLLGGAGSTGSNAVVTSTDFFPFGAYVNPPGTNLAQQFTGKEREAESGNDYFGARYYASSTGRFMSPDWAEKAEPVPYAKLGNPQSLNLYAYVLNNPMNAIDPDGHLLHGSEFVSCAANAAGNGCSAGSNDSYKQFGEGTKAQQQSPVDKVAMKAEAGAVKLTRQALAGGPSAEYGGLILSKNANGSLSSTKPIHTGETSVDIDSIAVPRGYTVVGEYHTHPSVDCCESVGPSVQDVVRLKTPERASRIGYVGDAFTGQVSRYTQREPVTGSYDTHTYGTVIGTIP